MFEPSTQLAIDQELNWAENARLAGNEGKARVCARRAAGAALRAWFEYLSDQEVDSSAYASLNHLAQLKLVPADIKEIADRLLTRVAPDYTLPVQTDLIADARKLIAWVSDQIQGDAF